MQGRLDVTGKSEAGERSKAVGYLLAKAHTLVRARMTAALEGSSLHLGHVVLLVTLLSENDLTQVELAQRSGIEKSSVVLFLDALEQDGWVERRRHPSDRRAHLVHFTRNGKTRFAEIGKRLEAAERAALGVFSAADRKQLQDLLLRLIVHLE